MNADTLTCLTCATQRPVPNPRIKLNSIQPFECRKCGCATSHIAGTSKIPRAEHADTRKARNANTP